ncbi:hypothetical protein BC943DRAFT_43387 [Umbelopsis sp. AD052]|nr:hypothetical protein BC943DRAFT_43387 [Umbelopsis sp. AD052]
MTDEFKNGRKRSYPSDLPAGDSIENPIEIPDDLASKHDLNSTAKTSVPTLPDTALARSIYNEFMTPNNTFKSSVARTERLDRFNRYNRTSPQPTKPKSAPPVIKREETDVEDMNNNAVEDSLDGMVKEMRELLLDHRKTPPLVQPSTPPVCMHMYAHRVYDPH